MNKDKNLVIPSSKLIGLMVVLSQQNKRYSNTCRNRLHK
jgi:hypothetical protein